jgi:hypothetical protein
VEQEGVELSGVTGRRNGNYERYIVAETGDVVVAVQRMRLNSAQEVLKGFGRRSVVKITIALCSCKNFLLHTISKIKIV